MLSERTALPLALRGTRVVFHLLKQFSYDLETEVEVILTLFIKLISSETDTGEPRPGRMRVLAMEIIPGGNNQAIVRMNVYYTCRLCSDSELMRRALRSLGNQR
ncbi:hypothetical protein BGY98DRAFT_336703 [Russula aff. rugulosa BPL654]|nr:hypothetical protein BGY98DRAFT_336703 [Russula aff. rugulosa BPL654]